MSVLNSASWAHSEMTAKIAVSSDYYLSGSIRSGNYFTVTLYATATLNGNTTYPSTFNYDIYCDLTVNGSTVTKCVKNTNWRTNVSSSISATTSNTFTVNVGSGRGSVSASAHFYATNNPDRTSCCVNGITLRGSIPYTATAIVPGTPSPSVAFENNNSFIYSNETMYPAFSSGSTFNSIAITLPRPNNAQNFYLYLERYMSQSTDPWPRVAGGFKEGKYPASSMTMNYTFTEADIGRLFRIRSQSRSDDLVDVMGTEIRFRLSDPPIPIVTFANNNSFVCSNENVYPAFSSGSTFNSIAISCVRPGSTQSCHLYLERYMSQLTNPWQRVTGGYRAIESPVNTVNLNYTFRKEDIGYAFRLRSQSVSTIGESIMGSEIEFRLNSLPTMLDSSVKVNVKRTKDAVTLSWDKFSDYTNTTAAGSHRYKIHVYNGVKLVSSSISVTDVTSHTFNLSSCGIKPGETATLKVVPGDVRDWATQEYGTNVNVIRNSPPYFLSGSTIAASAASLITPSLPTLFKDKINLYWNSAIDAESIDKMTYRIYYKAQNETSVWGEWTLLRSVTTNYATVDCSNITTRGKSIQFGVVANDGLEDSIGTTVSIISNIMRRDDTPPAVTNVKINPENTNYETIDSVSWTHVVELDGSNCSKYIVTMYEATTQSVVNPVSSKTYTVTTNSLNNIDISNIARGNYIMFKVKAINSSGIESSIAADSIWVTKNRKPNATTSFKVNSTKSNFFGSIPLIWDKATDPDEDTVTYTIFSGYNNSTTYTKLVEGLTNTTYSHSVTNRKPADTISYKIVTVDKYGVCSDEKIIENSYNIKINTKPNPPKLIYPISTVYDNTPRILMQTNGDVNNDNLIIKITVNGQKYNSMLNTTVFNKNLYSSTGDKIVFIPPTLNVGENSISIQANDGYEDSSISTIKITYAAPLVNMLQKSSSVLISTNVYNNFVTMISNSMIAYGLLPYNLSAITSKDKLILSSAFTSLYDNINKLNLSINTNYPGLNRVKTKPSIIKGNLITKDIYNSILEVITNL